MTRDEFTIHAVGDETLAGSAEVGFSIPFTQAMLSPTLGPHVWRMIEWVFELPPMLLSLELPDDYEHRDVLVRLHQKVSELAASPYLAHKTSLYVSFEGASESIKTEFPHKENTTGFLVNFRQTFDSGEFASYANASRYLRQLAKDQGREHDVATLDRWGTVHKKLRKRPPATWVSLKERRLDRDSYPNSAPNLHHPRTSELIDIYLYGDLVHYGHRQERLSDIKSENFSAASHEMALHEGLAGLSMFYCGFAEGVGRVLGIE